MGTLGTFGLILTAVVLLVLLVGVLVMKGRRSRAAATPGVEPLATDERPRTVADLVRSRAEAAARPPCTGRAFDAGPEDPAPVDTHDAVTSEPGFDADDPSAPPPGDMPWERAARMNGAGVVVPWPTGGAPAAEQAAPAAGPAAPIVADTVSAAGAAVSPPARSRLPTEQPPAEHVAADLALLRALGFTDAAVRRPSAPVAVVSLAGARATWTEPVTGEPQPVAFQVVRRDDSPPTGIAVRLFDWCGCEVAAGSADATGHGIVQAPGAGGYVLVCTASGCQPRAAALTVHNGPVEVGVLLARSAALGGVVCDGFRFTDLAAGWYALAVAAPSCPPVGAEVRVDEKSVQPAQAGR